MAEITVEMATLKNQAIVCTACGLVKSRLNVVFGSGDATAKFVIVAEGPSATDETTLRPFSGPSGDLLDEALGANGLTRDEIWLTNVINCSEGKRTCKIGST